MNKRSRLFSLSVAVAFAVLVSVLSSASGAFPQRPGLDAEGESPCGMDIMAPTPTGDPNGEVPEYAKWRSRPRVSESIERLKRYVEGNPLILGIGIDDERNELILDVDKTVSRRELVRIRIESRRVARFVNLDFKRSCHSAEEIGIALDVLTEFGERSRDLVFGYFPEQGKVSAFMDQAQSVWLDDLRGAGEVLEISELVLVRSAGGRFLDSTGTRYGDARIIGPKVCSSFVALKDSVGNRFQATAKHCGTGTFRAADSTGALSSWGTTHAGYQMFTNAGDFQVLWDSQRTYSRRFYTSPPGLASYRNIIGQSDASLNHFVCAGGATTEADCSAEAYGQMIQCYAGDCFPVTWLRRPATQGPICAGGDSGGVAYKQSGSSNAYISGMITAYIADGNFGPAPVNGYYTCEIIPMSYIQTSTGLSAVTSGF